MLKKLDIYIIKKFLGTYFYAIILIVSIAVIFDVSEKIDDFLERDAPLKAIVFDYYFNFIPYFVNLFSSLFTFISVIFFTSKMASDTEIIAILSGGISFRRMLWPYFLSAFVIVVMSFVLSNYVIPPSNKVRLEFEEQYIRAQFNYTHRNVHRQILPGVYIYMESYNNINNIGYRFSIERFEKGILKSKLLSDYIAWDTVSKKWQINNYYIRNYTEKGEKILTGVKIDTVLNMKPTDFNRRPSIIETMNYGQLNRFIEEQKMQGSEVQSYLIAKYRRLSGSFAAFILTLIGVSLASRKVRGGLGMHIGFGILISFSYIMFFEVSSQFAINGNLSPLLAVWLPNILFTIIGIFIYKLAPK